ncbi:MAG: hypothetical protein A2289_16565 [Deltaproteobacteria bacterium RIFOXYA12_FULL_58_15]|nr:MAG: hypothetical protein A2289_16565 [Deltaproteobacteria bacterium RIFOXYA12_FULL_58_15]OGR10947.1 MAG: hypothetical protein A2341_11320 [Deltaproteobacteria bacterium RIFOXYB12_FULL_58_9]
MNGALVLAKLSTVAAPFFLISRMIDERKTVSTDAKTPAAVSIVVNSKKAGYLRAIFMGRNHNKQPAESLGGFLLISTRIWVVTYVPGTLFCRWLCLGGLEVGEIGGADS